MSKFSNTLNLVIKHWPRKGTEETPIIRQFALIATAAGSDEREIQEFCETLSDEFDASFTNGIHAANMSH